jgi:hypothetical protein
MIKKYNTFLDESVRDKMTPISKEDILSKISNTLVKTIMKEYYFDNIEVAQKWILEHINEITRLAVMYPADRVVDMLIDMTDIVKRKFNLQSGGIVDNGKGKHESVIINKENIKEIFEFIKKESPWPLGGYYFELEKGWDIIDKMYDVKSVKLSIPSFSKDGTYDGRFKSYISFTFDVGARDNPTLVFDANNTKTPYIWIRMSNASWITISMDESDLEAKIKRNVK